MIVGCYSLHVYCDEKSSVNCWTKNRLSIEGPIEYTGDTRGECQKTARKDGWSIRKGKAVCSPCRRSK